MRPGAQVTTLRSGPACHHPLCLCPSAWATTLVPGWVHVRPFIRSHQTMAHEPIPAHHLLIKKNLLLECNHIDSFLYWLRLLSCLHGGVEWLRQRLFGKTQNSLLSSFAEKGCQLLKSALGFPRWLSGKESDYHTGDAGSIPGLERSPMEGNSNPFQYTCLENPMDRGAWWATVHGIEKELTELLNNKQQSLL